jgi:hypothetical protein
MKFEERRSSVEMKLCVALYSIGHCGIGHHNSTSEICLRRRGYLSYLPRCIWVYTNKRGADADVPRPVPRHELTAPHAVYPPVAEGLENSDRRGVTKTTCDFWTCHEA